MEGEVVEEGKAGEESVEVDAGKVDPCSIEGLEVWGEEGEIGRAHV